MRVSRAGSIVAWLLGALLVTANAAGYGFDLYRRFWWFDRALHAGTLFALTFWLAAIVLARGLKAGHRLVSILLIAAVGIACGALWEVIEWALDKLQPADLIKGKNDTILDIIMDTAGSLLAAGCMQPFLVEPQPDGAATPHAGRPTA